MSRLAAARARAGRRLSLVAVAVAVAAGGATTGLLDAGMLGHASPVSPARTVLGAFHSVSLDSPLHYLVRLPPGYARGGRRYPVIYFLHGLPAGPSSYQSIAWVGQALDRAGGQAILVVPQGTRSSNGDPEYLDWGPGNNWATALSAELPAFIDAHYSTIASRAGRALVGVSAGGYGATNLGLHHPGEFSVVESWSGYFEPTDATGETVLDLGSAEANIAASVDALAVSLARQFLSYPTFLAFYVGRADKTFARDNIELNTELKNAGVTHTFALYSGGHTLTLWKAHAVGWLAMALKNLAPVEA